MPNQPMQINRKEFQELLKEIQQYNKLDLVAQAIQTKYAKEMTGEDHEERLKAQQDNNDILKKIYDAILTNGKQTEKVADNVDKLAKETKNYKPVSDIKDDKPATIKEDLKSLVAGTKRFGSGIKSAVTGAIGSTASALKDPLGTLKEGAVSAGKLNEGLFKQAGDILATPEDYTVEGGRFAEAYSKTDEGKKGGEGSLDVGLEKFNELKAKEEEIKGVEQKINEQKKYGFEPNKGDVEQLESLKSQYAEADIRTKPVSAKETIESKGTTDNPNITDTPQEKIAEETEKHTQTFKELLDVTKMSLGELKAIRSSLEGTSPASQPGAAPKAAPVAAAPAVAGEEGGGLSPLDLLGRGGAAGGKAAGGAAAGKAGAAGAAKAGFGAKALGALKAGGAMLGKGALVAGKVVAGAALAKPALIAAGVGLAAYGAYKGYQALTSKDEEQTGHSNPPGPDSQQKEYEKKVQERLNEYPPEMRDDVSVRKNIEDDVSMEMNYIPSQTRDKNSEITAEQSEKTLIAGEEYVPGQPLSDKQMAVIGMSKSSGNTYSPAVEEQYAKQSQNLEGRQAGGPMTAGKPYMVGESGPEVVVPTASAKVMPAQSKTIDLGGGESKKINPDGSYETRGAYGTKKYDKEGNLTAEISPRVGGYQKETKTSGEVTQSYQQDNFAASQTSQGGQVTANSASYDMGLAKVSTSREAGGETKNSMEIRGGSEENNAMKDEMAAGGKNVQPVVMNNVSNNTQTTYVPVKGEPRPNSRGSALDRYNDRVAAY